MSVDARTTNDFRKAEFFGRKALFSNFRLEPGTLPASVVAYYLREGEQEEEEYNEHGEPCPPNLSIAKNVFVNHFGTVLFMEKIAMVETEETTLGEVDWEFLNNEVPLAEGIRWLADNLLRVYRGRD